MCITRIKQNLFNRHTHFHIALLNWHRANLKKTNTTHTPSYTSIAIAENLHLKVNRDESVI